jgi:hypothetical protein
MIAPAIAIARVFMSHLPSTAVNPQVVNND